MCGIVHQIQSECINIVFVPFVAGISISFFVHSVDCRTPILWCVLCRDHHELLLLVVRQTTSFIRHMKFISPITSSIINNAFYTNACDRACAIFNRFKWFSSCCVSCASRQQAVASLKLRWQKCVSSRRVEDVPKTDYNYCYYYYYWSCRQIRHTSAENK